VAVYVEVDVAGAVEVAGGAVAEQRLNAQRIERARGRDAPL